MIPSHHTAHDPKTVPAIELERYFAQHPEPLVRAMAERLAESEAELATLRAATEDEYTAAEKDALIDELLAQLARADKRLRELGAAARPKRRAKA